MEVGTNNVFEVLHRNSSFCLEAAKNKTALGNSCF